MNIALCTDEKYAYPCGVCVTSILENNKNEECHIYILTNRLSKKTLSKFHRLSEIYKQKIEIIFIDDETINGLKVSNIFPKSIYYRFLLPQIVKESRVLYLDCDIIVTGSLRELWDTDISHYACAAVEDQASDDITNQNRIGIYGDYFNSGVLLMNLDFWRKNNTANALIDFIYENPDVCEFPDQDALNIVLHNQVLFLEYKYNYQEIFYWDKSRLYLHKKKWNRLLPCDTPPTVIHYSTSFKPWYKGCTHPLRNEFIKYKNSSPWKKERIKSKNSLLKKFELIIKNAVFILRK